MNPRFSRTVRLANAAAAGMLISVLGTTAAAAQTAADTAAIRATALDYAEGWYDGDAERMQRALHPELAKRIVRNAGGTLVLDHMGAAQLTDATRRGGGSRAVSGTRQADVHIHDIFGNTASVRLTMNGWIDYMHMARWQDRWLIVNVLWELKPR